MSGHDCLLASRADRVLEGIHTRDIMYYCVILYLGPTGGQYYNFILPEFVSYLGGRGVLCVGNGQHCCKPVLLNMSNITFQVLSLSTFVFNKCSQIIIFTIIFVVRSLKGFSWNEVGPASQTVAQHYINIGPMYRVIWCF